MIIVSSQESGAFAALLLYSAFSIDALKAIPQRGGAARSTFEPQSGERQLARTIEVARAVLLVHRERFGRFARQHPAPLILFVV